MYCCHKYIWFYQLINLINHIEGYQWGGGSGRMGGKVRGIRSITGRYNIDRGMLRIVWEMEKPKNLYI